MLVSDALRRLDRNAVLQTPKPSDYWVNRCLLSTRNTKLGIHLNPWQALLKTQQGELFQINPWQHVPADEDGRPMQPTIEANDPVRHATFF